MSARRNISVFNMSFLDLITNYLGATTILLLIAMQYYQERPCPTLSRQTEASYDAGKHKIHGDIATHISDIKPGDSILVIVRDLKELPAVSPEYKGDNPVRPVACALYPKIQKVKCDDNGTKNNPADDKFSFQLVVEKNGNCGGRSWHSNNGYSGRYGEAVSIGPFPMKEGDRNLLIMDVSDRSLNAQVTAFAPNCGSAVSSGGCRIIAYEKNKICNDGGTPGNPSDDTFTFDLMVENSENCGNTWTAKGKTGRYGTALSFGPFPISQGVQKFNVNDTQYPEVSKWVEVSPPMACSGPDHATGTIDQFGSINFYLKWNDKDEMVDLYVQKGSKWVHRYNRRDITVGNWSNFKPNLWVKTDCEGVMQEKPVPGIYKVYAHYKGRRSGADKTELPMTLTVTSQSKPGTNLKRNVSVPKTRKDPKFGGGKLLITVEISPDGTIIPR